MKQTYTNRTNLPSQIIVRDNDTQKDSPINVQPGGTVELGNGNIVDIIEVGEVVE